MSVRIRMDTSKAMALLGFPSSKSFEHTNMGEIQSAFMLRVHTLESQPVDKRDLRAKAGKKDQLRRVNEAYQFLTKKCKKLSGRSMTENWQTVGGKSKIVQKVMCLKTTAVDQPVKAMNPLQAMMKKNEHLLVGGTANSAGNSSNNSSGSESSSLVNARAAAAAAASARSAPNSSSPSRSLLRRRTAAAAAAAATTEPRATPLNPERSSAAAAKETLKEGRGSSAKASIHPSMTVTGVRRESSRRSKKHHRNGGSGTTRKSPTPPSRPPSPPPPPPHDRLERHSSHSLRRFNDASDLGNHSDLASVRKAFSTLDILKQISDAEGDCA